MTCFSSSLFILLLRRTHFLPSIPKNLFAHILSLCHLASFQPPIHFEMASPIFASHFLLSPRSHTLPSSTGSHHPQRPRKWFSVFNTLNAGYYTKHLKYFLKQIEVHHKTTAAKCALLNLPNSWPFSSDDPSKVFSLCMFSELSLELSIHCLHLSPAGSVVLCIVGRRCQSKNCIRQKHSFVFQTSLSALALRWRGLFFVSDRLQLMLWQLQNATLDSISYVKLRS